MKRLSPISLAVLTAVLVIPSICILAVIRRWYEEAVRDRPQAAEIPWDEGYDVGV
jgi:hypothetical protein